MHLIDEKENQKTQQNSYIEQLTASLEDRQKDIVRVVGEVEKHKTEIARLEMCIKEIEDLRTKESQECELSRSELQKLKILEADSITQIAHSMAVVEGQQLLISELNKKIENIDEENLRLKAKQDNSTSDQPTSSSRTDVVLAKTLELIFRGEESLLLLFPDYLT
jgi:hypothetical protein